MANRKPFLGLVSAVVLAGVVAFAWLAVPNLKPTSCLDKEANAYSQLEQVAQETVGTIGDRFSRYSFCEESGMPGAFVRVSVHDWTARGEARAYLEGAGVVFTGREGTVAAVADGRTRIGLVEAVDHLENGGKRFVEVAFTAVN